MKLLLLDNKDSFVYNLVHYIEAVSGIEVHVAFNDEISLEEVESYDKILLSPGPGLPQDAGLLPQIIAAYASHKPMLGVCLGHQAIGAFFGLQLEQLEQPLHGVSGEMHISCHNSLFKDIPQEISIGHYHSWVLREKRPTDLQIIARSTNGEIMAFSHKHLPLYGVQFHPESILTPFGKQIIYNWLHL